MGHVEQVGNGNVERQTIGKQIVFFHFRDFTVYGFTGYYKSLEGRKI